MRPFIVSDTVLITGREYIQAEVVKLLFHGIYTEEGLAPSIVEIWVVLVTLIMFIDT